MLYLFSFYLASRLFYLLPLSYIWKSSVRMGIQGAFSLCDTAEEPAEVLSELLHNNPLPLFY